MKSTVTTFFSHKYTNYAIAAIILLFCMWIAMHSRTGAVDLDFAENYAENVINGNLRNQIAQEINSRNPLLSQDQRNALTNQEFARQVSENEDTINSQKTIFANQLKDQFQDENGQTYLIAIDTYLYYRFYRNIIETGQPGEYTKIVDGKERSFTNFMLAPTERDVTHFKNDFHVFFSIWIYKVWSFFDSSITPLAVFFMIPAIFASLMCIPAFFLGRTFGGNLGGFLLAFFLATNAQILARTPAGFSDTDIYGFFFPITVALFAVLSLKATKLWQQLTFAGIAGFFLATFSLAWSGWWNITYFMGALYGTYFLVKAIQEYLQYRKKHGKHKKIEYKKYASFLYRPAVFLLTMAVFTTLFGKNLYSIFQGFFALFSFTQLRDATIVDIWPNVFTTVAELNPGNFQTVIQSAGLGMLEGGFVLLLVVIGLALYLWKGKEHFAIRLAIIAMVITWFIAISYATTKGIRFLMFAAIPISIGASIAIEEITRLIANISKKELSVPKYITYIGMIILVVILLVVPISNSAIAARDNQLPSMNDGWYNTLTNIRDNSNETAIISSWWDFGHQFITIANRGATADGANQNRPQAHWLGKLLVTSDIKESTDILRMLNCGGNNAFDAVKVKTQNTLSAKLLVDQIITQDIETAKITLANNSFTETQINNITQFTHCEPPESFLITSEDMGCMRNGNACSGKTGVWAHFGLWDFEKSRIWNIVSDNSPANAKTQLVEEGLATGQEADQLIPQLNAFTQNQANSWIAPWPGYVTPMVNCQNTNGTLLCENGAEVNIQTLDAKLPTSQGTISPRNVVYVDGNRGYSVVEKDAQSPYSVVLRQAEGTFQMMIATPEIAQSTFTRLFYLEDGAEYYEKFSDVRDVQGQRIIVWKVTE